MSSITHLLPLRQQQKMMISKAIISFKVLFNLFIIFSPDFDLLKNFDPDRLHLRKSLSIMTSQFFNISNGIKWSADLYHNLFFYYSIQGSIDL